MSMLVTQGYPSFAISSDIFELPQPTIKNEEVEKSLEGNLSEKIGLTSAQLAYQSKNPSVSENLSFQKSWVA
jgi:hypothetical protein